MSRTSARPSGIQRAGRLVEDHELGPGHQRDRQPEALLHPLREAAHAIAGAFGQAHEGQAVALLLLRASPAPDRRTWRASTSAAVSHGW